MASLTSKMRLPQEDGVHLPPMNREEGNEFGWFDRMLFGWRDGFVYDYSDWEARDIAEMMSKDYKARQLENVLTLPIISASWSIQKGKKGKKEYEFLKEYWERDVLHGGCKTTLDQIIGQMTTAITYKRAYFEKVWRNGTGDFEGKIVYDKLGWRPQTTCRMLRSPHHGEFRGFEQEAYYILGSTPPKNQFPIIIPARRAFVYTHGSRRDPLNGSSDMEIAYWCWKMKQKILFLWFQFLEAVSLPRVVVKANDGTVANNVARSISAMKSSGIVPISTPQGPDSVGIDSLDLSGKGAEQFQAAVNWLDNAATNAVLAGFLNLTDRGTAMSGTGSFALSKDASDFFLQMEEAKAREIEFSIRRDLFAPMVRYNFGPNAVVPKLRFEPLNDLDKSTTIALLNQVLALSPPSAPMPGQPGTIPVDFVADLAAMVGDSLGMNPEIVEKQFLDQSDKAKAFAKKQSAAGASPVGQAAAGMGGAVDAATSMMSDPNGANKIAQAFGG